VTVPVTGAPSIIAATRDYESWLRRQTAVVEADLRAKHEAMASGEFAFLRATFYRWCQVWRAHAADLAAAPKVLAVGDLHVENFGTWRDQEGRLIWGVNDVDEASPMAYTNDLVRLATSARLAIGAGRLAITAAEACDQLVGGYRESLQTGGTPYVLDWRHPALRAHALSEERDPVIFWSRLTRLAAVSGALPAGLRQRLRRALPTGHGEVRLARRRAGVGSLGHQRVVAISSLGGGPIAREAKALVPPATVWLGDDRQEPGGDGAALLRRAVRCADPHFAIEGKWVVRRLAPDCGRIELDARLSLEQQRELLRAMGGETGNMHLASRGTAHIRRDLDRRPPNWLRRAAKLMAGLMATDQRDWSAHQPAPGRQKP
jgi:hypothetical protein